MRRDRIVLVLALTVSLAWCCLLFGIGLNDLTNRETKPGVIFSTVVLVLLIGSLVYWIWRIVRARIRSYLAKPS